MFLSLILCVFCLDTLREFLDAYRKEINLIWKIEENVLNIKFYTFEDLTTNHSRSATMQCASNVYSLIDGRKLRFFIMKVHQRVVLPLCLSHDDVVIGDGAHSNKQFLNDIASEWVSKKLLMVCLSTVCVYVTSIHGTYCRVTYIRYR